MKTNIEKFKNSLKDLIKEKDFTPRQFAEIIGVTKSTVNCWLRGAYYPKVDTLIIISEFFDTTVDYVLGRVLTDREFIKHEKLPFSEVFKKLMEDEKAKIFKLSKDLNITSTLIYNWKNSENQPTVESLIKLADYFGVSVDYLLGFER